jgi:hypothetical protein
MWPVAELVAKCTQSSCLPICGRGQAFGIIACLGYTGFQIHLVLGPDVTVKGILKVIIEMEAGYSLSGWLNLSALF